MNKGYRKLACAQCGEVIGFVTIQPHTATVVKALCDNCYNTLT